MYDSRIVNLTIPQSQYIIPSYPHCVHQMPNQSVSKTPNPPRTRPRASPLTFFVLAPEDPFVDDEPVAFGTDALLATLSGPPMLEMQSADKTPLGQQPLGSQ